MMNTQHILISYLEGLRVIIEFRRKHFTWTNQCNVLMIHKVNCLFISSQGKRGIDGALGDEGPAGGEVGMSCL